MIETTTALSEHVGVTSACQALGLPRSSFYRAQAPAPVREPTRRPPPKRALSQEERAHVRETLNSERFQDTSPRQVYARLLDEGTYLCSWRTMYRILSEHDEVRERRNQRRHPVYEKPELLATAPCQLWSWDITKLKGPVTWTYYYLYVILDVFSRYVVGWMIARKESARLAKELIETSCARQQVDPNSLVLHADRGPSMTSKTVAQLLVDLGVTKSHSRPHVSNDNPFSEAQFKTMKYRPDYPDRFGSMQDARAWGRPFFRWYNHEHYHSALGLMTPAQVHYGEAEEVRAQRHAVLTAAYQVHPERFVGGRPEVASVPEAVWINPPPEAAPSEENQRTTKTVVIVEQGVELVGRPEQSGGLSINPQPVRPGTDVSFDRRLLH
jgi:putative transposase